MPENKLHIKEACKERFAPVVAAVETLLEEGKDTPILIGIDGKAASGKTTLAYYLSSLFDCNLFHMDDFFLQPHQRTNTRLQEIGGNVDYERFYEEVLSNVLQKKMVYYRPYSCKEQKIQGEVNLPYQKLNIIEGSYSLHPYFKEPYDLKIFTDCSEELQMARIKNRNGEMALIRFQEEWIPKENQYFKTYGIRNGCLLIEAKEA